MPIYEYQCGACGEHSEILHKVNDPPALECPYCKVKQLKRLISTTCFQLKGTGWYVTDFRDKDKPNEKKPKEPHKKTQVSKKQTKDDK